MVILTAVTLVICRFWPSILESCAHQVAAEASRWWMHMNQLLCKWICVAAYVVRIRVLRYTAIGCACVCTESTDGRSCIPRFI